MAGLGGVDEHRRRAGGGEGGGNLAADVAALAHAHHDHAAANLEHGVHRAGERLADARLQAQHRGGLDVERLLGQAKRLGGVERGSGTCRHNG